MENRKNRLPIGEIRETDIVGYLSGLGYEPVKIRNSDYWYSSPLRTEKIPSFKVNRKLNRWYDHGLGNGGNIIDFGILYHRCTVAEFLEKLGNNFSFQQPLLSSPPEKEGPGEESKIRIVGDKKISSPALLDYLRQRRIDPGIAHRFCREIIYGLNGKTYYGIGFKNDSGGYEIRNAYFKAGSSPKDITTIQNGSKEAHVFEGFTDFLSFMAAFKDHVAGQQDFVVLNSVSLFEKARPFMEQHESVKLYLDHDAAGEACTRYAMSLSKRYMDESRLYALHKDLNDWLVHFGNHQKKNLGMKPG